MTLSEIKIKPYKRVGSYKSKKDDKRQLYLVVRVVFAKHLKRNEIKPEIKYIDKYGDNIRCLHSEYKNNNYPSSVYVRIRKIDNAIMYVVQSMMQSNIMLSTTSIELYLYDYIDAEYESMKI